jgi:threonine 3-dehydrogenase
MKAIIKSRREPGAQLTEVEPPKLGPGEVLAKMLASSICGTDIHIWEWNHWAERRVRRLPIIFGHEFCGEVVSVSPDVESIEVGDMISAETHIVDNTCYQCRKGKRHVCRNVQILGVDRDGVFAEYVSIPAQNAWKTDRSIDPELAALQEPLGNAIHTVLPTDDIDDVKGGSVAIVGCGPIGLMAIAVLKKLGARMVIATELGSERVRVELAKRMGADVVLDATMGTDAIISEVLELTGGNGVDVALEMSGALVGPEQVFRMLTPGGRVSILGLYDEPVCLDLNNYLTFKGATVYGITGRRMFQTWEKTTELLGDLDFREKIASIITHKVPIRDIDKAMELIHRKQAGKVSLLPEW